MPLVLLPVRPYGRARVRTYIYAPAPPHPRTLKCSGTLWFGRRVDWCTRQHFHLPAVSTAVPTSVVHKHQRRAAVDTRPCGCRQCSLPLLFSLHRWLWCVVFRYAGADAFVLPTHGEGWGRPAVEAMAMALPSVVTNWSGTCATYAHCTRSGVHVRACMLIVVQRGIRQCCMPTYMVRLRRCVFEKPCHRVRDQHATVLRSCPP